MSEFHQAQHSSGQRRTSSNQGLLSPGDLAATALRHPLCIFGSVLIALAAAFVWLTDQEPIWEAEATLRLRGEDHAEGAWSNLRDLDQPVRAAGELALLNSRQMAEALVGLPAQASGLQANSNSESGSSQLRGLGLQTEVIDEDLHPLSAWLHCEETQTETGADTGPARLWASVQPIPAPELSDDPLSKRRLEAQTEFSQEAAPQELRLYFAKEGRLEISPVEGRWSRLLERYRDQDTLVVEWASGRSLRAFGYDLVLKAAGDVTGKRFLLRTGSAAERVREVASRLQATQTEPGSGVLKVKFQDTDPRRSAEAVNALVHNYLSLHRQAVEERAADALAQIKVESDRLTEALQTENAALVKLQQESPLSISVEDSAKFLTQQITNLEVRRAELQVREANLGEAIDDLQAGRLEGLARVAENDSDVTTRVLFEHMGQLRAQLELQGRSDTGKFQHLLQVQILKLGEASSTIELEHQALLAALELFETDPKAALGLLGGNGPGATGLDPLGNVLIDQVARMQVKRDALLAGDYTEEHPDVVQLDDAITGNLFWSRRVLEERVEALQRRMSDHEAIVARTQQKLKDQPLAERDEIETAIDELGGAIQLNLEGIRGGLSDSVASTEEKIASMREELAALPAAERDQLGSLQRVDNLKLQLAQLLSAREDVRLALAVAEPPAQVLETGVAAVNAMAPRVTFTFLLAGLLGLCLGWSLAWCLEEFSNRIDTAGDFAAASGLTVLGRVPHQYSLMRGRRALNWLYTRLVSEPPSRTALKFGEAVPELSMLNPTGPIGITSARPRQGRTASMLGSAVALAREGRRVLFVNASIKEDFWLNTSAKRKHYGLADVLTQDVKLERAIAPSEVFGLDLLSAGVPSKVAVRLLSRPDARACLNSLSNAYDLVLVDLPSLEESPRTAHLLSQMDGFLFVARAGQCDQTSLQRSLRWLSQAGARSRGALFVQRRGGIWRRWSERLLGHSQASNQRVPRFDAHGNPLGAWTNAAPAARGGVSTPGAVGSSSTESGDVSGGRAA